MMLNDRADNDNKVTPHQSEIMRIFVFKSEANPHLRAFGGDLAGGQLPKQFAPWRAIGAIARPQPSPQPFPRRDRGGYQRARLPALAAEQAAQSDLVRYRRNRRQRYYGTQPTEYLR